MIGCLFGVGAVGLAIASALWGWSLAWVYFVAAISGAGILANGPSYGLVVQKNLKGNWTYFPKMWALHTVPVLGFALGIYYLVRLFAR